MRAALEAASAAKARLEDAAHAHRLELADWKRRLDETEARLSGEAERARAAESEKEALGARLATLTSTIATLEASEAAARRDLDELDKASAQEALQKDKLRFRPPNSHPELPGGRVGAAGRS